MLESLRSIFFCPNFGTPEIPYRRVGCAHRAWRVEQDGLNPGYLASDIWLRVAGHGLRISRYWNVDLGF